MAIFNKTGTALKCVKCVAHRGYSTTAPENTIPAYELAAQNGFKFVECDISLTSDGVIMLLHDATIDRTSNGSGTLSQMTYDQVRQYDFGSWKSATYAGTKIPTLAEFLECCADLNLHPYIELKQNGNYTEAQVRQVVDMVETYGLTGKVSYISFSAAYLQYVKNYDSSSRLGYVVSSISSSTISTAEGLQTDTNEVFIDSSSYNSSAVNLCATAEIPLEIWTLQTPSTSLNAYITGETVNGGDPATLNSVQECFNKAGTPTSEVFANTGLVR